jgi:hypothetical protein
MHFISINRYTSISYVQDNLFGTQRICIPANLAASSSGVGRGSRGVAGGDDDGIGNGKPGNNGDDGYGYGYDAPVPLAPALVAIVAVTADTGALDNGCEYIDE